MLVLTANIFKQRKMWKQVKSKVIIDVLLMTQEMKVIILQENSAAGNRGQIMVTWSVSKQGDRPMLSCPVLMMMMNTWQTTAPVTCICHYRGSPGHWPAATGDWVTRLHNIIIISAAALSISPSPAPRARVVLSKLVLTCQLLSIVQILYSLSTWNIALDTREAEREGMMGRCSLIKYK